MNSTIKKWWIYGLITCIALFIMVNYGGAKSFWTDEILQLKFTYNKTNIFDVLKHYISFEDNTPPFFGLCSYFWVKLVPYGQGWLRLLPQIAVSLGIFCLGIVGEKFWERKVGIISSLFALVSSSLLLSAGMQFRAYGFLFLFSCTTLYTFFCTMEKDDFKYRVLFGFSMICLIYSHYYGALFCLAIFLFETYLFLTKKLKIKYLYSYFIVGIAFLPWLITLFFATKGNIAMWPPIPDIWSIINLLRYLSSYQTITLFSFFIGVLVIIANWYQNKKQKKKIIIDVSIEKNILNLWIIGFIILTAFFYSRYFPLKGSIFYDRYFVSIIPCFFLICAVGFNKLLTSIVNCIEKNDKNTYLILISVFCMLFIWSIENIKYDVNSIYQPYYEAAEWLKSREDIYDENTLIILSTGGKEGWLYFLTEKGKLKNVNIIDGMELSENILYEYERLYLFDIHILLPEDLRNMLNEKYTIIENNEFISMTVYEIVK